MSIFVNCRIAISLLILSLASWCVIKLTQGCQLGIYLEKYKPCPTGYYEPPVVNSFPCNCFLDVGISLVSLGIILISGMYLLIFIFFNLKKIVKRTAA